MTVTISTPSSPTPNRVILVGAGIAGPALGIFLKQSGWDVVIYEKVQAMAEVGASFCLQSNGLKVLDKLGVLPLLYTPENSAVITHFSHSSRASVDAPTIPLITCPTPSAIAEAAGGYPFLGVKRAGFQRLLVDKAVAAGVEVKFGKAVKEVKQDEEKVVVIFQDGSTDSAELVIACDGLHSAVRKSLFGSEKAIFTGLTQVGGIVKTPKSFAVPAMTNIYGPNRHFICYPISDTLSSFAVTVPATLESKEFWGALNQSEMNDWKTDNEFLSWGEGPKDCVQGVQKILRFALFDRPPLTTWHSGRVLLIGDAAHPTSPHLGQGANQALEDVYHLSSYLSKLATENLSFSDIQLLYKEFETPRIARTSKLVQAARAMGESRTESDPVKAAERDEKLRHMWDHPEVAVEAYKSIYEHPF